MRIREEDCPKTTIRTRFESFEWRVLCFGLINEPASFSRLIASKFHELYGDCILLFLDYLLIYSKTVEEHKVHMREVFEILRRNKLYAKRAKCEFGVNGIEYLGYKGSPEGVSMQNRIVKAVLERPQPKTVKHVQSFVGLANYYRKFIKGVVPQPRQPRPWHTG